MAKLSKEDAALDMTPMIDVVFQLIIFFVVTIQMTKEINEEIKLADAPYGPPIADKETMTLTIEVDRRGWLSIQGAQLQPSKLRAILQRRYKKFGEFPILIRADKKTKHQDVRAVMDLCTEVGIWRISFAAIQEKKT